MRVATAVDPAAARDAIIDRLVGKRGRSSI
jgi:hypothetical protein